MPKKGRKVKCFATGEYGSSLEFVQHDKHWWKNEEVYAEYKRRTEFRQKSYDLYSEIIGYEKGQIFPGYIHKRFKKLEFYGWEVIYQNMLECRDSMEYAIFFKDFKNEIQQTAYLFAIMEGNINGCYARMKKAKAEKQRLEAESAKSATYCNQDVDLDAVQTSTQKKRDISQWLEEGA